MASKLRIKVGAVEVEYEGDENFLKADLPALLKAVQEVSTEVKTPGGGSDGNSGDGGNRGDGGAPGNRSGRVITTSIAAQKFSCSTGPELAEAAAFALTIGESKEHFSRDDLVKSMRSAKTFFKASYVKNLSATLRRMVNGKRLNEISADNFALPQPVADELKGRFGK